MPSMDVNMKVSLRDDLGQFRRAVDAAERRALQRTADTMAGVARSHAPVETGALVGSISARVAGNEAVVEAGTGHARPQEFGAGPHPIPWTDSRGVTRVVHHPGNPPHPFLRPAFEVGKTVIVEFLAEAMP